MSAASTLNLSALQNAVLAIRDIRECYDGWRSKIPNFKIQSPYHVPFGSDNPQPRYGQKEMRDIQQFFLKRFMKNLCNLRETTPLIEGWVSPDLLERVENSIQETNRLTGSINDFLSLRQDSDEFKGLCLEHYLKFNSIANQKMFAILYGKDITPETKLTLARIAKDEILGSQDTLSREGDAMRQILDLGHDRPYQRASLRRILGEFNHPSKFLKWLESYPLSNIPGERKKQLSNYLFQIGAFEGGASPLDLQGATNHLIRDYGRHNDGGFPTPANHQIWQSTFSAELVDLDRIAGTYCLVVIDSAFSGLEPPGKVFGPIREWPPYRSDLIGGPGAPWRSERGQHTFFTSQLPDPLDQSLKYCNGHPFFTGNEKSGFILPQKREV